MEGNLLLQSEECPIPDSNEPTSAAGDPLDAIIADCLQQVEAGNVPVRKPLLCNLVPKDGQGEAGALTRFWFTSLSAATRSGQEKGGVSGGDLREVSCCTSCSVRVGQRDDAPSPAKTKLTSFSGLDGTEK